MLVNNLVKKSKLAFVAGDFVDTTVVYVPGLVPPWTARYKVKLNFKVWMNTVLAVLEGISEIEIDVSNKKKFKISYFTDSTPKSAIKSISGFMEKVKTRLEEQESEEELFTNTIAITNLLSNDIVSDISSGIITLQNYEDHLPVNDVLQIDDALDSEGNRVESSGVDSVLFSTGSLENIENITNLASKLFLDYGIHPSKIGMIKFPATSVENLYDGISEEKINPPTHNLPTSDELNSNFPKEFYELYEKFVTIDDSQYSDSLVERSLTQKYYLNNILAEISLNTTDFYNFMQYRTLYLDLTFKDADGVEISKFSFPWNNTAEFQKLAGTIKPPYLEVIPGNPINALPDVIKISNPNDFDVRCNVVEISDNNDNIISQTPVKGGRVMAGQSLELNGATIYGSRSASRSYLITAYRDLPIAFNNTNVLFIKEASGTGVVDWSSLFPEISAVNGNNGATVRVANVPNKFDLIKVFRRTKGMDDKALVKSLSSAGAFEDRNLIHGITYVYEAEFYSNGAFIPVSSGWPIKGVSGISTILTYYNPGPEDHRVNFQITNINIYTSENVARHTFTIDESVAETPSEQYLKEIAESGQTTLYEAELEGNKTETSLFTRYSISRTNVRTGRRETVNASALANTEYTFTVTGTFAADDYEYEVEALIENLAAMSYLTVTTKVDVDSGKSYKFRYKKWNGKDTNVHQSLPSDMSIRRNSLYESIENSRSGRIQKTLFSPSSVSATITKINVERDEINKCNWLKWNFTATTGTVDHFLILGKYNGVTAPIGSALPFPISEGKYLYKDTRLAEMLGEVEYSIIPVRKGLVYGSSSSSATVKINSRLPKKVFVE